MHTKEAGPMTVLASYTGGQWRAPSGEGAPLHDAATGDEVAPISSDGIDKAAALDYGRAVGGPALRRLTLHHPPRAPPTLRAPPPRPPVGLSAPSPPARAVCGAGRGLSAAARRLGPGALRRRGRPAGAPRGAGSGVVLRRGGHGGAAAGAPGGRGQWGSVQRRGGLGWPVRPRPGRYA